MSLSAVEIKENFEKLIETISENIPGERGVKLKNLHTSMDVRIAMAPASMKKAYHNAFPGGYVIHILNVIEAALKIKDVWVDMGSDIDFTFEELYMAAICHDLGKLGTVEEEYYLPCDEQWLLKKGQVYVSNPKLQYMKVPERSLFLLQQAGITLTEKEYLTIKLHDGLYEEGNKAYLISYNEDYELKTILPYIIHQADLLCSKTEKKVDNPPTKTIASAPSGVKPTTLSITKPVAKKTGNASLDKFLNE
jgi:hypothetical protein